eukprot:EG_transcript_10750
MESYTGRIVSLPDLHGDLFYTVATLLEVRLIDAAGHWAGGRSVLVQTGDVVDRGPDTRYVLDYLDELGQQARRAGGAVVRLLGNHELMNLQDDYRYVAPEDTSSFQGPRPRHTAFSPRGEYGKRIMSFPATVVLNDTVFVHAGLTPAWAKMGQAEINRRVATAISSRKWEDPALGDEGPLWTRRLVYSAQDHDCSVVRGSLAALSAAEGRRIARIVVGHTPADRVRSHCEGALLATDAAISRQMGGGRVAAVLLNPAAAPHRLDATIWCHEGALNASAAKAIEARLRRRWAEYYARSVELPPKDVGPVVGSVLRPEEAPVANLSRPAREALVAGNAAALLTELQAGPLRDLPIAQSLYLLILLASTALIMGLMFRRPLPDDVR